MTPSEQGTILAIPRSQGWTRDQGVLTDFTVGGAKDLFLPAVAPDRDVPPALLLVNDGWGYFADRSAPDLPDVQDFSADAVAGSVDRDGDPDLFVAEATPALRDIAKAFNYLNMNAGKPSAVGCNGKPGAPALHSAYRIRSTCSHESASVCLPGPTSR